jgi:TetR/AcrR family transcriptional regulator, transcriptional repressor for nem operon
MSIDRRLQICHDRSLSDMSGFMSQTRESGDTLQRILDVAQILVQTRGYNAFSYADIAAALHVTKASLHYHFASKAELGHSLIQRYEASFRQLLDAIDRQGESAPQKIVAYIEIYATVLADHRMCLCGLLAAEFETLPKPMQFALDHFFAMNEQWLEVVLEQGQGAGTLHFRGSVRDMAQFVVATLEGGMMLARSHGAEQRFDAIGRRLLSDLGIA